MKTLLAEMERLENVLQAGSKTSGEYKHGFKKGVKFTLDRLRTFIKEEAKHEVVDSVPTADLQRYVRTGEATPALERHLSNVSANARVFASTESEDQPDGFGANS